MCRLFLPLLAVSIAVASANAQHPTIELVESCPTCMIEFVRVVTLGSPTDSVLLNRYPSVARANDGRYFASGTYTAGGINIYSPDGRFERTIGGMGGGLGEFSTARPFLLAQHDTIYAMDRAHITVIDVRGSVFTRKVSNPYYGGSSAMSGRYLFTNAMEQHDPAGAPLVTRVSLTDGSAIHVLRHAHEYTGVESLWDGIRILTAANDDGIWVAMPNRFTISQYAADGRPRVSLSRDVDWFQPWSDYVTGEPFIVRPRPRIVSMNEDALGRLWVITVVPDRNWRPLENAGGEISVELTDMDAIYDSVIEIIDVKVGNVLASGRSPALLAFVAGTDMIQYTVTDDDGVVSIHVVEPRIRIASH